jgi:DNA polymerase/3'-5' exonuclease PolX
MELQEAIKAAESVKIQLSPLCSKIEIVGSIRRKKPLVNDIDIVCIPDNQTRFISMLKNFGKFKAAGEKIIRVETFQTLGIDLDIYIANSLTWGTLMLIRTGSKEHNVKLCALARRNGMHLHADGSGLFRMQEVQGLFSSEPGQEIRVAGDTEESIFKMLGIQYVKPEDRN